MPKSSTPALFETTVRFLHPLRRKAAIRFSGMPQTPNPPIRIMTPSRTCSIAVSALATRLSIRLLLETGRLRPQGCRTHSQPELSRGSLLQTPQDFIEFVGGDELVLELPAGEARVQVLDGLGDAVQCPGYIFGVGQPDIAPHRVWAAGQAQHLAQAGAGQRRGQARFVGFLSHHAG